MISLEWLEQWTDQLRKHFLAPRADLNLFDAAFLEIPNGFRWHKKYRLDRQRCGREDTVGKMLAKPTQPTIDMA